MSLQRRWGTWVGEAGRPRRRSTSPSPTCESLEDRQLLSTAGLYRGGLGSSLSQRAYPTQVALGGAIGGFQRVSVASLDGGQAAQGLGSGRRLHAGAGVLGQGGLGMRNGLRMGRFQTVPGNHPGTPAALSPGGTSQAVTVTPTDTTAPVASNQPITAMPAQDVFAGATAAGDLDGWIVPEVMAGGTSTSDDSVTKAFEKLNGDTQAIQDKSEVTPKQLAAVRNDLMALTDAAKSTVSADALKTFMTHVQALDGKLPTDAERDQLVADFNAVVKSRGITDQGLIDKTVADVQTVAQSTHITADDLATIAADRKAIADATGADAKDTTAVKFGPVGAPTDMLLAGLTGGNLSGVPIGGGPFTIATSGAQFHGPMALGGGRFNVMAKAVPFDGELADTPQFTMATAATPAGGGPIQTFTYGGPMKSVPFGGPWGY